MKNYNAVSESSAKTFAEAGIINSNGFSAVTEVMIKRGDLIRTNDGKYFINKK